MGAEAEAERIKRAVRTTALTSVPTPQSPFARAMKSLAALVGAVALAAPLAAAAPRLTASLFELVEATSLLAPGSSSSAPPTLGWDSRNISAAEWVCNGSLALAFAASPAVACGTEIMQDIAATAPVFSSKDAVPGRNYTLIVVDRDARSADAPTSSPLRHMVRGTPAAGMPREGRGPRAPRRAATRAAVRRRHNTCHSRAPPLIERCCRRPRPRATIAATVVRLYPVPPPQAAGDIDGASLLAGYATGGSTALWFNYSGPQPPAGTPCHRYYAQLYLQVRGPTRARVLAGDGLANPLRPPPARPPMQAPGITPTLANAAQRLNWNWPVWAADPANGPLTKVAVNVWRTQNLAARTGGC